MKDELDQGDGKLKQYYNELDFQSEYRSQKKRSVMSKNDWIWWIAVSMAFAFIGVIVTFIG